MGSVDLQSSRELGDILDEENAWNVLFEESEKQSNKGPDQPRGVEDEPVSWPWCLIYRYTFFRPMGRPAEEKNLSVSGHADVSALSPIGSCGSGEGGPAA